MDNYPFLSEIAWVNKTLMNNDIGVLFKKIFKSPSLSFFFARFYYFNSSLAQL